MRKHLSYLVDRTTLALGLDVRSFGKNFTWASISQVVAGVFGLLLAAAFSRLLDKDTFRHYTYVQSLFGIVGFFGLSGMNGAVARAVAKKRFGYYQKLCLQHL